MRRKGMSKLRGMKELNITSLIDVMFILVIFFMVSSTLVVHPGMRVKVPEAKNAKSLKQDKFVVYVDQDNFIYLNENKVDKLLLKNSIVSGIAKGIPPQITVKADKTVDYGEIITVIDICKEAGIKDISFAAKKSVEINYQEK